MYRIVFITLFSVGCGKEEYQDCDYMIDNLCVTTNSFTIDPAKVSQTIAIVEQEVKKLSNNFEIDPFFQKYDFNMSVVEKISTGNGVTIGTQMTITHFDNCYLFHRIIGHEIRHLIENYYFNINDSNHSGVLFGENTWIETEINKSIYHNVCECTTLSC